MLGTDAPISTITDKAGSFFFSGAEFTGCVLLPAMKHFICFLHNDKVLLPCLFSECIQKKLILVINFFGEDILGPPTSLLVKLNVLKHILFQGN